MMRRFLAQALLVGACVLLLAACVNSPGSDKETKKGTDSGADIEPPTYAEDTAAEGTIENESAAGENDPLNSGDFADTSASVIEEYGPHGFRFFEEHPELQYTYPESVSPYEYTIDYDNGSTISGADEEGSEWSIFRAGYTVEAILDVEDGAWVVYQNITWEVNPEVPSEMFLMVEKINRKGETVQNYTYDDTELSFEHYSKIMEMDDGSVMLFSYGRKAGAEVSSLDYVLRKYDASGSEIFEKRYNLGLKEYSFFSFYKNHNGAVALRQSYDESSPVYEIGYISSDGDMTPLEPFEFRTTPEGSEIKDVKEYGDKLIIFANRFDRAEVVGAMHEEYGLHESDEYEHIAEIVRSLCSASLYLYDPETGEYSTLLSLDGYYDGLVEVKDGAIICDISKPVCLYYAPSLNSHTFGGYSEVYRYTITENGKQEKSERLGLYMRFYK